MNTKALRQKILDLAIHGKLVPQDPNDEPASVLLERIKAEKERLIKEGKIKRTKRSKATCDKPHYPYELPKGWEWCKLEDIVSPNCTLGYGIVQPMENIPNGVPIVRPVDLVTPIIGLSGLKRISSTISDAYQRTILRGGEILFCVRGSVGKIAISSHELNGANVTRGISPIRFDSDVATKYIFYHLQSYYSLSEIKRYSKGATLQQINVEDLKKISIAFPSIAEQKRIVESIEHWLSLVDSIEENKDNLQATIKQAKSKILDLAIHGKLVPQDPTDEPACELLKRINPKAEITCDNPHYRNLPKGWAAAPMQMLCSLVDGEKRSGVERINLDVKFLRGEREAKALSAGKYVAANTLLILVDGENSGEVFRTPFEGYQGSTFKQLAINDNMYTDYVLQVINLHRKTLRENKVGSAIPHLNKKLFKAIDVPIPPYEEQQRIVNAINKAFTTLDVITENL